MNRKIKVHKSIEFFKKGGGIMKKVNFEIITPYENCGAAIVCGGRG